MSLSRPFAATLTTTALLCIATPALAQRFTFDRTLAAEAGSVLDVSTLRGRIAIWAGDADHIVVRGTVTVRVGPNVPANAPVLAKQVADQPSIEQAGGTVRLRPPTDAVTLRAVTVSYEIRVPAKTGVRAISDSGAITVEGISGTLSVKTSSAAITLTRLGGEVDITTGSGAVSVSGADAAVKVGTQSSGIELRDLRAGLEARTQSGSVSATFAGSGDVDVETGSSAIALNGVNGGLTVKTGSGRVTITGTPVRPWTVLSTSGEIRVGLVSAAVTVDATTRSGSVVVDGLRVSGTNEKRHVAGAVGSGGPLVRLTSRSGSIRISEPIK